ncbi:hypothetical protein BDV06DRAFT_121480 [Aspergillus oleicola]
MAHLRWGSRLLLVSRTDILPAATQPAEGQSSITAQFQRESSRRYSCMSIFTDPILIEKKLCLRALDETISATAPASNNSCALRQYSNILGYT